MNKWSPLIFAVVLLLIKHEYAIFFGGNWKAESAEECICDLLSFACFLLIWIGSKIKP